MSVTDYPGVYDYSAGFTITPAILTVLSIISVVILIFATIDLIAIWKIFEKNGKKGWYVLIPFLNVWTLLEIGDQPGWSFLVPIYSIYTGIMALYNIPKKMGKRKAFCILTVFFFYICFLVLGFKKEEKIVEKTEEEPFVYVEEPKVDLGPVPVLKPLEEPKSEQPNEPNTMPEQKVDVALEVTPSQIKKCHKCSTQIVEGAIFCHECGEKQN